MMAHGFRQIGEAEFTFGTQVIHVLLGYFSLKGYPFFKMIGYEFIQGAGVNNCPG